jgi:hypothetical protein
VWTFNGKPFDTPPDGAYGFVYKITRVSDGKAYIGRKQFETHRRAAKRKTTRKRPVVVKPSNWLLYRSSCEELQAAICRLGVAAFKFEVLTVCYSKAALSYQETRHMFLCDVLFAKLPNGERAYWNGNINGKWFPSKVA